MEVRADQHVLIRAGRISPPDDLSTALVERGERTAHAELATGIADQHFAGRR